MGDEHEHRKSEVPPRPSGQPGAEPPDEHEKKRLFERAIPQLFKRLVERAVESGVEKLQEAPENLRDFVDDMKLPKEALHYLYAQIDDTKIGLYRAVAKEIRDVLEQTNLADEITKVLTKLSFEVNTQIRFVPNEAPAKRTVPPPEGDEEESEEAAAADEAADEEPPRSGLPRPKVTATVAVKDRSKEARRDRRRREEP